MLVFNDIIYQASFNNNKLNKNTFYRSDDANTSVKSTEGGLLGTSISPGSPHHVTTLPIYMYLAKLMITYHAQI